MDYFRSRSLIGKLSGLILLVAVVVQLAVVFKFIVLPDLEQLWVMRERSPYDRSVVFLLDEQSLNYLEFANSELPEDAVLVIPKRTVEPIFGHVGDDAVLFVPKDDC